MKNQDLSRLSGRLNELADYYTCKQPSNTAMKVWLDALGEVSIDDVEFVLTDWPKSKQKFPVASEVLMLARTRVSDRIEEKSKRLNASSGFEPANLVASSDVAREYLYEIKRILASEPRWKLRRV